MRLARRDILILALAAALIVGIYLIVANFIYTIGFPLDDSWIHQTYARNLALLHEWSFIPGKPSAGSTAPLWTFLLAIGFFLPSAPYLWTFLLGGLLLFAVAVLAESIFRRAYPAYAPGLPWVGLFFLLEWHLAWAAVSGMETLLHILVVTAVLGLLIAGSRRYLLLGLLTGVSVWVRPDGLTLLGPLLIFVWLVETGMSARLRAFTQLAVGFTTLFALYLLFNLMISGTPMPNTFYAKQAEYAEWPLYTRLRDYFIQFFAGPSIVVLVGIVQKTISAIRRREWGIPLAVVWLLGYVLLYLFRLPAYQHGRYLMPAMSVFLLVGLMGFYEFLPSLRTYRTRLARQAALTAIVMFSLMFAGYGATVYANDVAVIETQMVESAKWAAQNIPPGELIAAHDIGALGFFDRHDIVDLAGLISPEVVPFMRDETKLAAYMDAQNVSYFVAFPKWHPNLSKRGTVVFETSERFAEEDDNMTIYRWNKP